MEVDSSNMDKSPRSQFVAITSLVWMGMITVIPFLQPYRILPQPSFYSELSAFVLGFGACTALLWRNTWKQLSIPVVAVYLFCLVILVIAQPLWLQHVYSSNTLLPAVYLCWAILLITLAGWLRDSLGQESLVRVLAWFILIGGVLQTLISLVQLVGTPDWLCSFVSLKHPEIATISGNLAQSNHFADQISLSATALIYLFSCNRIPRAVTAILITLFAILLSMSGSRMVMLYLSTMLILSTWSYYRTRDDIHLRFTVVSAALFVLFLACQFSLHPLIVFAKQILAEWGFYIGGVDLVTALDRINAAGFELRITEWHKAWLMLMQSPILGVGLGNYGWNSFLLQSLPDFSATDKPQLFSHSHNLFAQISAEMGITGSLILLAALIAWIRQFRKIWLEPSSWFIAVCLSVLFIHSNLEYPLWYSYFLGIAAILMGAGNTHSVKVNFTPWLGQVTAGAGLALIFLMLAITFSGYKELTSVNSLVQKTTPEYAAQRLDAVSKNPLLTPLAEITIATHGMPEKTLIQEQTALTKRVMLYRPDPTKVQRHITYLALAGHPNEAIALLRQMATVYPNEILIFVCRLYTVSDAAVQPLLNEASKLLKVMPASCIFPSDIPASSGAS